MSTNTKIEWTDATWNPATGCTRASEGCRNCYIERSPPFRIKGRKFKNGTTGVELHPDRLDMPLRRRKPTKYFVNSLSDLFHDDIPDYLIDRVFTVMAIAQRHTFQVLTKRPERMRAYLNALQWERLIDCANQSADGGAHGPGSYNLCSIDQRTAKTRFVAGEKNAYRALPKPPLPNIWLGVSIENQQTADERIPLLLQTPAAVRFISAEPLLGPVDIAKWLPGCNECGNTCGWRSGALDYPARDRCHHCGEVSDRQEEFCSRCGYQDWSGVCLDCGSDVVCSHPDTECLDWVIVGGESGPGARPMHPDWARSICYQCQAAGVPFFFKHWGEWTPDTHNQESYIFLPSQQVLIEPSGRIASHVKGFTNLPEGPPSATYMGKVGKTAAGRLLEGREWNEYPACP